MKPPKKPWKELSKSKEISAYLSVYLSDELSSLPIRAVSLLNNNKSDPNIETNTYGLFSTCSQQMRYSAVNNGVWYVIFITRRNNERVITGYYRLKWYTEGVTHNKYRDYVLAADKSHFICDPIKISRLPTDLKKIVGTRFRLSKKIDSVTTRALLKIINSKKSCNQEYLDEIDRLERFNLYYGGYRYISWKMKEKFTWALAKKYLQKINTLEDISNVKSNNSSPTDIWCCASCGYIFKNKALLKKCPECDEFGTLKPH